jgi:ubiquinone/menaquinone biosynthesis C-methylase UbiE
VVHDPGSGRTGGAQGVVVGVDISAPKLALGRQRVAAAGGDGIEFLEADAQAHPFEGRAFDAVISRFGTMSIANPEAAFTNLARALRPGGRLVSVLARPDQD